MITSNMRKLAIAKMARDAIPDGGGLASAISFLTEPKEMVASAKAAEQWAKAAVQAVRLASKPNPWATADDETIAAEILKRFEDK